MTKLSDYSFEETISFRRGDLERDFTVFFELAYFEHEKETFESPERIDFYFERTFQHPDVIMDLLLQGWELDEGAGYKTIHTYLCDLEQDFIDKHINELKAVN